MVAEGHGQEQQPEEVVQPNYDRYSEQEPSRLHKHSKTHVYIYKSCDCTPGFFKLQLHTFYTSCI